MEIFYSVMESLRKMPIKNIPGISKLVFWAPFLSKPVLSLSFQSVYETQSAIKRTEVFSLDFATFILVSAYPRFAPKSSVSQ